MSDGSLIYFYEMMAHPALFTHPKPVKVAIIGNANGILQEVLKHQTVQTVTCIDSEFLCDIPDIRVQWITQNEAIRVSNTPKTYDVVIVRECSQGNSSERLPHTASLLDTQGLLIQPYSLSLFEPDNIKLLKQIIKQNGFQDWRIMHIPKLKGWQTIIMATKCTMLKDALEKNIFNRSFQTRYYNYDMHKAAFAIPECMRTELETI